MDKVIIVTGGAGGIGSDICRGLASDGLKVVIADYAKEAAENIAAEIRKDNREAIAIQVDVGSKQSVADMVKATLDKCGRIDFLLNGAGVLTRVSVVEMPEEDWDRVLRINLKGTFLCSQAVAHHMIPKKQGRIISNRAPLTMPRPKPASSLSQNRWRWNSRPMRLPSMPSLLAQPIRPCRDLARPGKSSRNAKRYRH